VRDFGQSGSAAKTLDDVPMASKQAMSAKPISRDIGGPSDQEARRSTKPPIIRDFGMSSSTSKRALDHICTLDAVRFIVDQYLLYRTWPPEIGIGDCCDAQPHF
jgi:hypothetical protein